MIAKPDLDQHNADHALAWGLADRGDRQLSVLLPVGRAEPSLLRAPWLVPSVRVLTYAEHQVEEPAPLTQVESIKRYGHWDGEVPAELGERSVWVRPLLEWVRTVPGVDTVAQKNYVAWHVHGRQVLKITPGKNQLTIVAGVDAKHLFLGKTPVKATIKEPASDHVLLRLMAATALAAADRLEGLDGTHAEHRMQSLLRPESLGLQRWKREFRAWRPGSDRSAFIDFLGVDANGRVNVVETKIGPDAMLIFQGLDYWLWCRANETGVGAAFRSSNTNLPVINYVVAPDKKANVLSVYTAGQAEALHPTIPWRFVLVDDPATVGSVQPLPRHQLPPGAKRPSGTPRRWALRLHAHALVEAGATGVGLKNGHTYADLSASLLPAARAAYTDLAAKGLGHNYIGHVRSSQAFALNMLAPLSMIAWTSIARYMIGHEQCEVIEPPEFEYSDPLDQLAEKTLASPHATQVDCLVRVQLHGGGVHLLFIEVKLSEDNFSTCSAYTSAHNPRKHICANPLPFGGDTEGCFQLCNHDREHRRRYDVALELPPSSPAGFGCWFRDGTNQVMRNTALARQLIQRGEAVSASIVLMAPDGHRAIWQQWKEHTERLDGVRLIQFRDLPASRSRYCTNPARHGC